MVTKKHASKDPVKINSKQFWEFAQKQDFGESINTFDHSFLFSFTAVRLPMQNLTGKNERVLAEQFNFEKRDKSIWKSFFLIVRTDGISKLGVKKLIFHTYRTFESLNFLNEFCSEKINLPGKSGKIFRRK